MYEFTFSSPLCVLPFSSHLCLYEGSVHPEMHLKTRLRVIIMWEFFFFGATLSMYACDA